MTLKDRFTFISNLIKVNGLQWYNDNVLKMHKEIVIKDSDNRGIFTFDGDIYYADDCSIVQVVGFK